MRFNLSLGRQRNMHGHLVAVEVCVEGGANQRVNLNRLAFDQHGLECLNAQAVQRRRAVEHHGVVLNHLLEDVPDNHFLLLDQFLGLFDRGAVAALLEPLIDERLEQLQRHLFRQTALIELQVGTDNDDGTTGIIDALAEQILAETPLLALERIGQRFQRAVVGAAQQVAAPAVVEQRIDGLLQHAFLVAHDHVGRIERHQLLETVVAVDHAAIEIVEIGGGETAAVERHERTQLRRNHRNVIENHPLGFIAGAAERLDNPQPARMLELLLNRRFRLHRLAQLFGQLFDVELLEDLLDPLRAHHRRELVGVILIQLPFLFVADDLAFLDAGFFFRFDDDMSFVVEHALKIAQRGVEQLTDTARQSLEEPHVRAGRGQLHVAHPFAADAAQRHFGAALLADHAAVLHALVLAAQAFPIGHRTEDRRAEKTFPLGFERPVVDRFGFVYLAERPTADLLRRGKADPNRIEIGGQIYTFVGAGSKQCVLRKLVARPRRLQSKRRGRRFFPAPLAAAGLKISIAVNPPPEPFASRFAEP